MAVSNSPAFPYAQIFLPHIGRSQTIHASLRKSNQLIHACALRMHNFQQPVPLPVLRGQLLPWTVWFAHMPLSPVSYLLLSLSLSSCCLNSVFLVVVPRCLACLVLWTWSAMSGPSFLLYMPPPLDLLMLQPPHIADNDNQTLIPRDPPCSALDL
jgi:hypothetical protein